MICAQYVICWTGPPVTPAGTALQLEWASSVLQPACPGTLCTLQSLSLCSIFLPLSSFLSFSPVSPTPSLPHFLPPSPSLTFSLPPPPSLSPSLPLPHFLPPSPSLPPPPSLPLPPSLTPSLLSSCSHVHVHQQGHLWQNYTYHLSSLNGVMNVWGSMLRYCCLCWPWGLTATTKRCTQPLSWLK